MKQKFTYYVCMSNEEIKKISSDDPMNTSDLYKHNIFPTFIEAKQHLIKYLENGYRYICQINKENEKRLFGNLQEKSGLLEEDLEDPFVKIFKKAEDEFAKDLYDFYEECGVKWNGDFMYEPHSRAFEWCEKKVFGVHTIVSNKRLRVKIPKEMVQFALEAFDKNKDSINPLVFNYDLEKIEKEWRTKNR